MGNFYVSSAEGKTKTDQFFLRFVRVRGTADNLHDFVEILDGFFLRF